MGKDRVEAGRGRRSGVKAAGKTPVSSKAGSAKASAAAESSSRTVRRTANRSKAPFYALLALVAVAAGGFIVYQAASKKPPTAVTIPPGTPLPKAEGYLMGKADAPVQVLEFGDFECPVCSQWSLITEPDVRRRLVEPGTVAIRYLDFPLEMHPNTWPASMAAACANEQGRFWEMHDQLFSAQDQWNGLTTKRPKPVFKRLATAIGLDVPKWESCFDSQKYRLQIAANQREGETRHIGATPTFIIGDKMIANNLGFDEFKAYVDSALAANPSAPKPSTSGDSAKSKAVAPPTKDKKG